MTIHRQSYPTHRRSSDFQDYYNWVNDPDRVYLPPLVARKSAAADGEPQRSVALKKTFTTRKGALVIFSEDFARRQAEKQIQEQKLDDRESETDPQTVGDFMKCILSYGEKVSTRLCRYRGWLFEVKRTCFERIQI